MRNHVWALIIVIAAAACGPSFKNVKATAELGQAMARYPITLEDWVAECQAIHAASEKELVYTLCLHPRYASMVEVVEGTSALLQAYASSLLAAAEGRDVTTRVSVTSILDQVGTLSTEGIKKALPSLFNLSEVLAKDSALVGKLSPSGINTIVDTIVGFASRSYRRTGMARAVADSAPHVDVLLSFLEAEIELHVAKLQYLRKSMANEILAHPLFDTTHAVAQMLPFVVASLDERITSLQRFDATCQAFRTAHAKLAQRIAQNKAWEGDELLQELRADIEAIAKTVLP